MNRLGKLLALGALGSISLGTTLEAQDVDPVGVYGITINADFDGQVMQLFGTLTIEDSDNGLTGSVDTDMGITSLSNIVVEGSEMKFNVDAEGMLVAFEVEFEDDGFSGDFDLAGLGGGTISGTKR
ncbi:MAG TPA: hypothetical protein EYQ39_05215 [Gemmatimonadetes bacterium]|jgi:hypothetical protein|nr:hypothetical protein [Gemmatimonadota bacterium]HIL88903.1 hypothetical protein [Gemmatimonadota bacterium]